MDSLAEKMHSMHLEYKDNPLENKKLMLQYIEQKDYQNMILVVENIKRKYILDEMQYHEQYRQLIKNIKIVVESVSEYRYTIQHEQLLELFTKLFDYMSQLHNN